MSQQTRAPSADNELTVDTECTRNSQDGANQDGVDPLQEIHRLLAIPDLVDQKQNERADLVELLICRLCRKLMVKPTLLPCGHTFCRMCIWTQTQATWRTCPRCLQVRPESEQRVRMKNYTVQALIDAHVAQIDNADRQAYAARVQVHTARERRLDPMMQAREDALGLPINLQQRLMWNRIFVRNRWDLPPRRRRPRRRALPPLQRPQNRA